MVAHPSGHSKIKVTQTKNSFQRAKNARRENVRDEEKTPRQRSVGTVKSSTAESTTLDVLDSRKKGTARDSWWLLPKRNVSPSLLTQGIRRPYQNARASTKAEDLATEYTYKHLVESKRLSYNIAHLTEQ